MGSGFKTRLDWTSSYSPNSSFWDIFGFFFINPAALNTALPSPLRVGIFSHLKSERAELRPAGTGGSRSGEGLVGGIEVEEEGEGVGKEEKKKREFPQSRAGVRNSEL